MIGPPPDSTLIQEWVTFLTPIAFALMAVVNVVIGKMAATKVEEAKTTLAANTAVQSQKLTEIHTLVNNDHGVSLRLAASALQRVADLTNRGEDQAIADEAKRMSDEHDSKQRVIDAEKPKIETDVPGIKATLSVDPNTSEKGTKS
jgi:phosphoenolpyruvate carboxylase